MRCLSMLGLRCRIESIIIYGEAGSKGQAEIPSPPRDWTKTTSHAYHHQGWRQTMSDVQAAQSAPASEQIDKGTIQAFRAKLRGNLILPGDPAYDTARKVYNG